MWKSAWFVKMLLNVQGAKVNDVYQILPFDSPDKAKQEAKGKEDTAYLKNLLALRKKRQFGRPTGRKFNI